MRAIKENMKDHILDGDNRILHCLVCDGEYSGNAGDYFSCPDDYVFTCCETEMELVNKTVTVKYE